MGFQHGYQDLNQSLAGSCIGSVEMCEQAAPAVMGLALKQDGCLGDCEWNIVRRRSMNAKAS